jgi:hypothetical protein
LQDLAGEEGRKERKDYPSADPCRPTEDRINGAQTSSAPTALPSKATTMPCITLGNPKWKWKRGSQVSIVSKRHIKETRNKGVLSLSI